MDKSLRVAIDDLHATLVDNGMPLLEVIGIIVGILDAVADLIDDLGELPIRKHDWRPVVDWVVDLFRRDPDKVEARADELSVKATRLAEEGHTARAARCTRRAGRKHARAQALRSSTD